jgi:general secretion pathway protein D
VFGDTNGQKKRTEIIMFIKPQLVRNGMDARHVAEEFRSSLELMRAGDPIVPIGKAPVVIPLGKATPVEPIAK